MEQFIDQVALIASVILPFWNIPLILRIIKRKSSKDISLLWVNGVWICFLLMMPSALRSDELTWKVFTVVNIIFFSVVLFVVLLYRYKEKKRT